MNIKIIARTLLIATLASSLLGTSVSAKSNTQDVNKQVTVLQNVNEKTNTKDINKQVKIDNPIFNLGGGDSNYIVYRSYSDVARTYGDLGDMLRNFQTYNAQKSSLSSFTDAVTNVLSFFPLPQISTVFGVYCLVSGQSSYYRQQYISDSALAIAAASRATAYNNRKAILRQKWVQYETGKTALDGGFNYIGLQ